MFSSTRMYTLFLNHAPSKQNILYNWILEVTVFGAIYLLKHLMTNLALELLGSDLVIINLGLEVVSSFADEKQKVVLDFTSEDLLGRL